jgi:hypothetical protein
MKKIFGWIILLFLMVVIIYPPIHELGLPMVLAMLLSVAVFVGLVFMAIGFITD